MAPLFLFTEGRNSKDQLVGVAKTYSGVQIVSAEYDAILNLAWRYFPDDAGQFQRFCIKITGHVDPNLGPHEFPGPYPAKKP
jgi:hypothetical protein